MPRAPKKVSLPTLRRYVGLLGANSLAADCLRQHEQNMADGYKSTIYMLNNGFKVERGEQRRVHPRRAM
jgi:hypothetical protein